MQNPVYRIAGSSFGPMSPEEWKDEGSRNGGTRCTDVRRIPGLCPARPQRYEGHPFAFDAGRSHEHDDEGHDGRRKEDDDGDDEEDVACRSQDGDGMHVDLHEDLRRYGYVEDEQQAENGLHDQMYG